MTFRLATEASKVLKESFAGVLQAHTNALSQVQVKADLDHIQSVGAALEPLVRSAKVVHGWGDEQAQGLIISMKEADPDSVTDVVSSVTDTVTPELTEVSNQIEQIPVDGAQLVNGNTQSQDGIGAA